MLLLLKAIRFKGQLVAPPIFFEPPDGPESPQGTNREREVHREKEHTFGIPEPSSRKAQHHENEENNGSDCAAFRHRDHGLFGNPVSPQVRLRGILPPVLAWDGNGKVGEHVKPEPESPENAPLRPEAVAEQLHSGCGIVLTEAHGIEFQ
jgi:hypothetical protein